MKRHEAITCLREINTTCRNVSPDSVELVDSQPNDEHCTGYQLHIQLVLDNETEIQIRAIASKYCFALRQENGKVVIYQPKTVPATTP
jgi:hypothetical protein